mmetsp:Transcript_15827/g.36481  ORF Transcript_15827/g.36481 Transcript_15827/m.36481 type:complete len:285 (-) Transcript_15827:1054-1908(-)
MVVEPSPRLDCSSASKGSLRESVDEARIGMVSTRPGRRGKGSIFDGQRRCKKRRSLRYRYQRLQRDDRKTTNKHQHGGDAGRGGCDPEGRRRRCSQHRYKHARQFVAILEFLHFRNLQHAPHQSPARGLLDCRRTGGRDARVVDTKVPEKDRGDPAASSNPIRFLCRGTPAPHCHGKNLQSGTRRGRKLQQATGRVRVTGRQGGAGIRFVHGRHVWPEQHRVLRNLVGRTASRQGRKDDVGSADKLRNLLLHAGTGECWRSSCHVRIQQRDAVCGSVVPLDRRR